MKTHYLKPTIAEFERRINSLQTCVAALRALLPPNHRPPKLRHVVSLEGRKRIAAAQRKRWAKVKRVKSRQ